jgi:hypothetical protein
MAEDNKDQAPEGAQSEPQVNEELRQEGSSELAALKAERDQAPQPEFLEDGQPNPEFIPMRDCDRILDKGLIVKIDGVPCRLLEDVPVMSATFRDEAVFVEHVAEAGAGLAAIAPRLRGRYNGSGARIGINEDHPLNVRDARIAELEAEAEAEAQAKEE